MKAPKRRRLAQLLKDQHPAKRDRIGRGFLSPTQHAVYKCIPERGTITAQAIAEVVGRGYKPVTMTLRDLCLVGMVQRHKEIADGRLRYVYQRVREELDYEQHELYAREH